MQYQEQVYMFYQTGRYQCDLQFYTKLLQIVKYLNLYQHVDHINKNIQIVTKIINLTNHHSDSLHQDYDQDKAIDMTKKIQIQITKIDTNSTKIAIQNCKQMNKQSYQNKIINLIKKCQNYGKQYLQICQKSWKNIHSDQHKIDTLLIIIIFMIKNKSNLKQNLQIYNKVIQKGLLCLKQFTKNIQFIQNHSQIHSHPKVKNYLEGTRTMISVLLKFYSIVKALEGRSNLLFKLNAFKSEIQNYTKIYLQQNDIIQQQIPIRQMKQVLKGNKNGVITISSCCNWCLRPTLKQNPHKQCIQFISYLLSL